MHITSIALILVLRLCSYHVLGEEEEIITDQCNITRKRIVYKISPYPTPVNQRSATGAPSITSQVSTSPTGQPTFTPTLTSTQTDCKHEMLAVEYYQAEGASLFKPYRVPIEVAGQDGRTVTFIVHQAWNKDDSVSWVATEYKDTLAGWTCQKRENVPYGPMRKFTALCDADGWARVNLYAQDEKFNGIDDYPVPEYCAPSQDAFMKVAFFYKVPCSPGCYPLPSECIVAADLVRVDGSAEYKSNPVEIVSQNSANVTFTVLQTWVDEPVCFVATSYPSTLGREACDRKDAVKPGSGGTYTAKCQNGTSTVILFVHQTKFDPLTNKAKVPDLCKPNANDRVASYTFRLPCEKPSDVCIPLPVVTCEAGVDHVVAFEDFEAGQASTWTFGDHVYRQGYGHLLGPLDADLKEVFKVFEVSPHPLFVKLDFSFLQSDDWDSGDKFYVRLRGQYLDLLSFLGNLESKSGYFSDLGVSIQARAVEQGNIASDTFTAKRFYIAQVKIPQRWYTDGHLMVGFKVALVDDEVSRGVAVDTVRVTSICDPVNQSKRRAQESPHCSDDALHFYESQDGPAIVKEENDERAVSYHGRLGRSQPMIEALFSIPSFVSTVVVSFTMRVPLRAVTSSMGGGSVFMVVDGNPLDLNLIHDLDKPTRVEFHDVLISRSKGFEIVGRSSDDYGRDFHVEATIPKLRFRFEKLKISFHSTLITPTGEAIELVNLRLTPICELGEEAFSRKD